MIEIVRELPAHVELSEHLRGRADFYLMVLSFGVGYYIPATPDVRRMLGLDKNGHWLKHPASARAWRNRQFDAADALRDIVGALSLQVRDVELAGVEEGVTRELLDRMATLMRPTIRKRIADRTKKPVPKNLLDTPKPPGIAS
jgi:hypothetical protein